MGSVSLCLLNAGITGVYVMYSYFIWVLGTNLSFLHGNRVLAPLCISSFLMPIRVETCNAFNAIHLAVIATVQYKLSTKIKGFIVILALHNIS